MDRAAKAKLIEDDFAPRLERMWREQDYLRPRALLGYFPCNSEGNELIVWDPEAPGERERERLTFPRQPKHDRIALSDFYRPVDSGEVDVCALQAVTVGPEVTDLMAKLEAEGEFAEQLFVHGLGVQSAEGLAEWLHATARRDLGIEPDQGRRYSWGYPACPDQSEHEKVFRLLGAESIGLKLSGGHAVEPEQSTVAIVAHHPQAVYFGMKSGRLPEGRSPDELIAGTARGGALLVAAAGMKATAGVLLPFAIVGQSERRRVLAGDPVLNEAYEVLRANLVFQSRDRALRVVTFLSQNPAVGKTSAVEGFAYAAVRGGSNVLVIDGDLRAGTLSSRLGYADAPGLTNVIVGTSSIDEAIVSLAPGLSLLTARLPVPNPPSLLYSDEMRELMVELRDRYDLIGHLADGLILASLSDGVVAVARTGVTKRSDLRAVIVSLRQSGAPLVGLVVFEPRTIDKTYYPAVAQATPLDRDSVTST